MSEHKGRRGAPTQLPTAGRYLDLPRHAEFNETVRTSSLIGDAQPRREGTDMSISLIQPIAMEDGLKFAIREGGRTVGAGRVTKILK